MSRSRRFPGESAAEHGIKEFINDKERQLKIYQQDIEKDEYKLRNSEKAIENLERALPFARRAAEIQKQNLEAFSAMRTRNAGINIPFNTPLNDEESSRSLCTNLGLTLAKHRDVCSRLTDALTAFAQNRLNEVVEATRQLEADLHSWRFSRHILQKSIMHSKSVLKQSKIELNAAKRPFWRVPPEVWVDIFRWRIQGDLDTFHTIHTARPFQPTVMILSKVCRLWRNIVNQEPELWRYIAIHPYASWPNKEVDLLKFSLGKAKRRIVLVSNLSQSPLWNDRPSFFLKKKTHLSQVNANVVSERYDVTLVMSANDTSGISRVNELPFSNPRELAFVFPPFTQINSPATGALTPSPLYLWEEISNQFPSITKLSLEVDSFLHISRPRFVLPPTLQALRIRHSGERPFFISQNNIHLPNLVTLEITPPATSLFEAIDTRCLRQLVLYGPKRKATVAPTPPPYTSVIRLQSVEYLEFHEWLDPRVIPRVEDCDAISALRDWGVRMPRVRKLKFIDSYVDGRRLLNLLKNWQRVEGTGPQWEVTLDCCTGIRRYECDELKGLVEKVNVFV
ncbi:hypothetical protein FRC19_003373 [Serendipita sp. 401]|nr:hypothetical protein FRC19_003373 [Serendipita sp. 401]KAG9052679.1 hypothetical protein FS842_009412 [Serendipita sp. 407]